MRFGVGVVYIGWDLVVMQQSANIIVILELRCIYCEAVLIPLEAKGS